MKAADRVLGKTEGVSRDTFEAEQRVPDVPWASIRGMGNFLRHEYDNVQADLIWTLIANGQLRALRDACAPYAAPRDA
ncbi:hypothetical protein C882_2545 [Caenispirillum salinarum AK4]|uniref:DUF86 domain-containing protein n=1 Tax=Caenispirillum salinarum AK4 TaxID=1238182 RepID=K9HW61_9PROT|nr:hypothetical protein C882_2545 [Caenispirillum salinarum AK4]